jgi:outer membrane lipoprotein-sorting protein
MANPAAGIVRLLGGVALASLAWTMAAAQGVPLPTPSPQRSVSPNAPPRPSAPIPLDPNAQQNRAPDATATTRAPAIRPPTFFRPGEATAFDARQRALVDRVSTYLTSIRQLSGDFVQVGPDGSKSAGEFYLQKPGRVRFDYNPPNPTELIADGSSVVVRDRKLATQDLYPLSQTPLRFLLADQLDLLRDTNLVGVYADDVFVSVVIEERQIIGGTHRLMLMFGAKDFQLRQWTVTDPQGYDTTVALYNLDSTRRPDPSLFRIDYTRDIR